MALDTTGTILTIRDADTGSLDHLRLYSAHRLRETLEYIDGSINQARTVTGELVDLALERFRKMKGVISATDVRPPSLDIIYPGRRVIIESTRLFSYAIIGGSPGRTQVAGSTFDEGGFRFYRPTFTAMIGKPSGSVDEWEADQEWQIPWEEI